eukprot:3955951-Prymnesium_polylepis.1
MRRPPCTTRPRYPVHTRDSIGSRCRPLPPPAAVVSRATGFPYITPSRSIPSRMVAHCASR